MVTPAREAILSNLNHFLKKHIQLFEAIPASTIKTIDKQIVSIKQHIENNCLSGIEPGYGSEANEQLHKLLNRSMLRGATVISFELAEAILTVLFHHYIENKKDIKHDCNSLVCLVKPMMKYQNLCFCAGEGENYLDISNICRHENLEEENVAVEFVLDNTVHLFKALQALNTLCTRSRVNILDSLVKKLQFTFSIEKMCLEYNEMSQEQLQSNLSYFGIELEEVFIMEDSIYYALLFHLRACLLTGCC